MLDYSDLKFEYRLYHDGDNYGHAIEWLFAVAAELYWRDPSLVPVEWQYEPGACVVGDPLDHDGSYAAIISREAETYALEQFGELLSRYVAILKATGRSY